MRGVRCQRCGHMFSLSVNQVMSALGYLAETGGSHYGVECSRCRHLVKVPRGDLERMRPRRGEPGAPVPASVPE
ncbi:MAG: hypothetical protein N0A03_03960 [Anaerolineae bacterium]|nr:hypothetical protein [Anaerolineae bacterium]